MQIEPPINRVPPSVWAVTITIFKYLGMDGIGILRWLILYGIRGVRLWVKSGQLGVNSWEEELLQNLFVDSISKMGETFWGIPPWGDRTPLGSKAGGLIKNPLFWGAFVGAQSPYKIGAWPLEAELGRVKKINTPKGRSKEPRRGQIIKNTGGE